MSGSERAAKQRDGGLSSRACARQHEINNPSFLMPRYRASSRLYNAVGARTSDGIVSRTGLAASKVSASKYKLPR